MQNDIRQIRRKAKHQTSDNDKESEDSYESGGCQLLVIDWTSI